MKLEETIQTILDKYPTLFGDRESVLVYLYCYFGTGYDWVNGELVSDETNCDFKGKLNENGLAAQKLSEEESCLKYIYLSEDGKSKIKYKDFQAKMDIIKKAIIINGKTYNLSYEDSVKIYEKIILGPYLVAMRKIREGYILNANEMLNKKYSPLYNIPSDIKEDWYNGVKEVKNIIGVE